MIPVECHTSVSFYGELLWLFCNFRNGQNFVLHLKTNIKICKFKAINAVTVLLIGWSGVVGQNTQECRPFILWDGVEQMLRAYYLQ